MATIYLFYFSAPKLLWVRFQRISQLPHGQEVSIVRFHSPWLPILSIYLYYAYIAKAQDLYQYKLLSIHILT